jgi:hypothetical protein
VQLKFRLVSHTLVPDWSDYWTLVPLRSVRPSDTLETIAPLLRG